ncbi:MAG: DUF4383 domain-containing protein [Actinomycetota bacterium]|nr:DUF4383 domain-containing protein [Actinomycetota bacterium]
MAADATAGFARRPDGWTPARIFMVVSVLYHLPLAIAGLAIDQTFPFGGSEAARAGSEHVFGIFETNGWHSLAALLVGLASVYFAVRPERAREAALVIGVGHVGVFLALTFWAPETFWLASNAADQVVHASTAVLGTGAALLTGPGRSRASTSAA